MSFISTQRLLIIAISSSNKKDIINQDSKLQKLDTLLIVCETGEVEYDESFIKENHIDIVYIEDESELTVDFFNKLDKDFEPARVVIEYNSF